MTNQEAFEALPNELRQQIKDVLLYAYEEADDKPRQYAESCEFDDEDVEKAFEFSDRIYRLLRDLGIK